MRNNLGRSLAHSCSDRCPGCASGKSSETGTNDGPADTADDSTQRRADGEGDASSWCCERRSGCGTDHRSDRPSDC